MRTAVGRWMMLAACAVTLPCLADDPPAKSEPAKPALDLYGDPLPQGVIVRLGSVRFRHGGPVEEVAFSDDGKRIAASSIYDKVVVVWDRDTGRKVLEIPGRQDIWPPSALHFSADGKRLYLQDKGFSAWDLDKGAPVKDFPVPPDEARALGYSPDGREVILEHKADFVRWDLEKCKERGRCLGPKDNRFCVALVGDRLLAPLVCSKSVDVFDLVKDKRLWSVQTTREKGAHGLPMALSPDGKLFTAEIAPKVISLYETESGRFVRRFKAEVEDVYWSVQISPDKKTLAASNMDGTLRLWDVETGRERAKIAGIEGRTTYMFFAPDSKCFATGGPNNAHGVVLWDTATGERIESFPGHSSPVSSMAYSPDGQTVATSSRIRGDVVVRLWDPQTGRMRKSLVTSGDDGVSTVLFSPDSSMLAVSSHFSDGNVHLWDLAKDAELRPLAGRQALDICIAFSPDGKRAATGETVPDPPSPKEFQRLIIWDVATGKPLHEVKDTPGEIHRVVFTRDGRQVLVGARGIHVYDTDSGAPVDEPLLTEGDVCDMALSADGRLLVAAEIRGGVHVWELATRRKIPLNGPDAKASHIALTGDGRTLAISSRGEIQLYHWPSEQVVGKLGSADSRLGAVCFSPDCRRLATEQDASVLIWDVAKMVNQPLPAVAKPTEKELQRWWQELRDDDPAIGYKAIWRFAAVPEQAVPFLAAALRPVKAPDAAVIAGLIADLDNDEFELREQASRRLEQLGELVGEALRKKLAEGKPSAEQTRRIKSLLAKLTPVASGERLQTTRALAALEQIGGREAQKVFASIAEGAPDAATTREAKAALERLKRTDK